MLDNRKTALYCRTAQADDGVIENQKKILLSYAEKHGYDNTIIYTDNGISGSTFNRPAMQSLFKHINDKMISTIIVTDFSRFSRNIFEAERVIIETLKKYNVRFIDASDNYQEETKTQF